MVEHRDPAIEAARRALVSTRGHGNSTHCEIAAAREALKPIRELHKPTSDGIGMTICAACTYRVYNAMWPCDTARLVYTSEELSGE